jgi:hypothetical protein
MHVWLLMNEIEQSVSYVALHWNKLLYNISHYCLHHSPIAHTSTLFEEENWKIILSVLYCLFRWKVEFCRTLSEAEN